MFLGVLLTTIVFSVYGESNAPVLEDGNIKISKEEISNAIKYWNKSHREEAGKDYSLRYDLLNSFIVNYRMAGLSDKITADVDPTFYWQNQFAIRNLKNKLYLKNYIENLKLPDMTELAKQTLMLNKDKYGRVPEKRKVSHILLKCVGADCNRKERRKDAEKILKDLEQGANFEDLVAKFSEDPGSKQRNGKIKNDLVLGAAKVDPYFTGGAFSIEKVGGYSEVVSTRFGLHIIRLDEIIPSKNKSESENLPEIIKILEKRYKLLAEKAFVKSLKLSDKAKINQKELDNILSEYNSDQDDKK